MSSSLAGSAVAPSRLMVGSALSVADSLAVSLTGSEGGTGLGH